MADTPEEKNVADLDFKIDKALNKLEQINKGLEQAANKSQGFTDKISKNLNGAIVGGNIIDINAVKQKYGDLSKLTDKQWASIAKKQLEAQIDINKTLAKEEIKATEKKGQIQLAAELKQEENAQKHANKMEEIQAKSLNRQAKQIESISDKISNYAKTYIIYQGFNKLKQAISETINEMVEVQYQMVQIERVMNEAGLDINNFRDKLIDLASAYGNSFDNVADVSLRLAQAGIKSEANLKLTEKTLLALNTAELDATQATSDMIAVMSQWGAMTGTAAEQSEWYGETIDKINKVADNFPTTSADILNALKKTSSAFNLAGASIDETIATIVAAEKASQRGGKVIGTALSNIIQQLKDAKKIDIAESLGINFFTDETKEEFKDIMTIFGELSERMQKLKDEGKESSAEMQELLTIFTVFRRNIGASLLGEMSGEDSTYNQVLKMIEANNALGYSLEENKKHMNTAKAAQAQFNAELLKLKTEVWDKGLEEVFRGMLSFGTDLAKNITNLIDKFGVLPTAIGAVTLAFTALNKNFKNFTYNAETGGIELSGFLKNLKDGISEITKTRYSIKEMENGQLSLAAVTGTTGDKIKNSVKSFISYTGSLALATAKTIALQAATIALNAAISLGLSLAISSIVKGINDWIHANEKALESINNTITATKDKISKLEEEENSLKDLINGYEELAKKENRSPEDVEKISKIQEKINETLKEQGKQIDLINGAYDEQLSKLKAIDYEKQKEIIKEKEALVKQYQTAAELSKVETPWWLNKKSRNRCWTCWNGNGQLFWA